MAEDTDVEDALDMSLKAGENEERQIVEVRSGRNGGNGGKIPLARIERRSLDGGEQLTRGEPVQRGVFFTFDSLPLSWFGTCMNP